MANTTRIAKTTAKKLDAEIGRIYRESCEGIAIPIMEIPNVYAAGRTAYAEGRDVREAIVSFVETIRK